MTRWEYRTVVVRGDDDGSGLAELGRDGWEAYAALAHELLGGPGALDAVKVKVLLKRPLA